MTSGLATSLSSATTTESPSRSSIVASRRDSLPLPWGSPQSLKIPDEHHTTPPSGSDLGHNILRQLLTNNNEHPPPSESGAVSMSPAMMFLSAFTPSTIPQSPDAEGEIIRGYVLGPTIGYGGFSIIKRASSPSGGVVAVKIVRRSDLDKQTDPSVARKRLNHEAQIWASLCHEHTLPLFFAEHTPYADFFFSLFCPAGSLYDILLRDGRPALPHDDTGMMFRQIVRGVRYLHEVAGYVHRDIKLENVLVDEMGICRICDFGMTRKIGEVDDDEPLCDADDHSGTHRHRSTSHISAKSNRLSITRHHGPRRHRISTPIGENPPPVHASHAFQQGSLPYASPELLQPKASRFTGANPAQDIWALGVLLYGLLTGRLPFFDSFEPRLQMKILHGVYDMPSGISRGTEHVLRGCLERSVRIRWTIATVDEMAWGVGLDDDDDDDDLVTDKGKFEFVDYSSRRSPSSSQSRSCSRSCALRDNNPHPSHTEEDLPRRSSRSLSRASISTASSLSTRCSSRSISRPPVVRYPMSPTYDELSHSVVSASTSPSVPPLDIGGPALLASPGPSPERGRRQKKAGFLPPNRCTTSLATSSHRSEYTPDSGDLGGDVGVLGDTAHWASTLGINAGAEPTAYRSGTTTAIEHLKAIQEALPPQKHQRAESTPSALGAWSRRLRRCIKENPPAEVHGVGGFLRDPSTTPIPNTPKGGIRSRSVGHDTYHANRRPH